MKREESEEKRVSERLGNDKERRGKKTNREERERETKVGQKQRGREKAGWPVLTSLALTGSPLRSLNVVVVFAADGDAIVSMVT